MSFCKSVRVLGLMVLCWLGGPRVQAQCIQLGGTGCPTFISYTCTGQPRLGNVFTIVCPSCRIQETSFIVIGTCPSTPYLQFFPPLACDLGPCRIGVTPVIAVIPAFFSANVPFNASLVGQGFCVQCGCINQARGCLTVANAVQIVIQ